MKDTAHAGADRLEGAGVIHAPPVRPLVVYPTRADPERMHALAQFKPRGYLQLLAAQGGMLQPAARAPGDSHAGELRRAPGRRLQSGADRQQAITDLPVGR